MAVSYSDAFRLSLARIPMGGLDVTAPASYDLGLFTGDPNNGGVECSGTGYARLAGIDNDATTWTVVGGSNNKTFKNGIEFEWTAAAGTGWGAPNWVCVYEAGTSTKLWAFSLDNAVPISTGDPFRIQVGALTVQFLN